MGVTQLNPAQQSALFVQAPHAWLHVVLPHTYGGVPPGFGTQGRWLQQSALDAQPWPAWTHCPYEQRGTPTLSRLQVYWAQSPCAVGVAP